MNTEFYSSANRVSTASQVTRVPFTATAGGIVAPEQTALMDAIKSDLVRFTFNRNEIFAGGSNAVDPASAAKLSRRAHPTIARFPLLVMLVTLIQTVPAMANGEGSLILNHEKNLQQVAGFLSFTGDGSVIPEYGSIFGRTVINTFPGLVGGTPVLSALAEGASGRTWLFGNAINQVPNNRLLIARLNADSGLLDASFGGGSGQISTVLPAGVTSFLVSSAVIQADGKPIVAGNWAQNGDRRGFVCRLNVAGNLDAGYASGGCRVLRSFLYINERCEVDNIAADPSDQSLIAAGNCTNIDQANQQRPFLTRLTSAGNFSVEFGAGAGLTTPILNTGQLRSISAVAIQPGGRFVGIGNNLRGVGDYDISALQFGNDGTLDASFGVGGVFTIAPDIAGNRDDFAGDIAVRPDGRILMLGLAEGVGQSGVILLHQLTAGGANDAGFGTNGRFLATDTLSQTFAQGGTSALFTARPRLAIDDLGRAVVLSRNGLALNDNPTNPRVYRFTVLGGKDPNFGPAQRGFVDISNGIALAGFGGATESLAGLSVNSRRILLGLTSRRTNATGLNMVTVTLLAGSVFNNGFE